jgi:hypothetical protein
MHSWATPDRDHGESLVEVLVSVVVLALVSITVGQAMWLGVKTSDIHRKQSVAGSLVRDYAEHIETGIAGKTFPGGLGYVKCPSVSTSTYASPAGFTAPSGYTASIASVSACASPDAGVQTLKLQVRSNDNRATESLTLVVRNPCAPSDSAC